MRVLGFSGGLSNPSKTLGLVQAIVNEFSHLHQVDVEIIDLAQLAHWLWCGAVSQPVKRFS